MATHICNNPAFDMFICRGCHPEAPRMKAHGLDRNLAETLRDSIAEATYSTGGDTPPSYWLSLHLNLEAFAALKELVAKL